MWGPFGGVTYRNGRKAVDLITEDTVVLDTEAGTGVALLPTFRRGGQ